MRYSNLIFATINFLSVLVGLSHGLSVRPLSSSPISLSTKTSIPNQTPTEVHSFLATPANWPKIVASSVAVEIPQEINKKRRNNNSLSVDKPFRVGDKVNEIFGLPPILPLSVQWTCTKSILPSGSMKPGRLEFDSDDGLEGIASNCRMVFDIFEVQDNNSPKRDGVAPTKCNVNLTMQYTPISILANLAVPVLVLDNAFALKVLLPWTMNQAEKTSSSSLSDLDKFRKLMGTLYGIAGLAHFADCIIGPSQILIMAGAPEFQMLPTEAQAYVLLWCFVGPLSFILSRAGGSLLADAGLVLYGLVEVFGAALITANVNTDETSLAMDPLTNAIIVQGIVAAAWVYSSQKKSSEQPSL